MQKSYHILCNWVLQGLLSIKYSFWWALRINKDVPVLTENTRITEHTDPKIAYENYEKDCVVLKYFKIPYVSHINCIIENIIRHQDNVVVVNNVCQDNSHKIILTH